MGMLLKALFFKGEQAPFVMELPPYRLPTVRGTLIHMWERGYSFIRKAGTIIFGVVVLVWLLSNIPWGAPIEKSVIGRLGQFMAPSTLLAVLVPGRRRWRSSSAFWPRRSW